MNFPKKHNLLEIKNLAEQLLEAVEAYEGELYERRDLHSPEPTPRLRALRATMERLTDNVAEEEFETLCRKAFELFLQNPDSATISFLQRKLRIGDGKAALIVDELEDRGYIAKSLMPGGMPCKILKLSYMEGPNPKDGMLFDAVRFGDLDGVKLLLEGGASANARGRFGYTVLMDAARMGDLEIAKLLLEHGASINATTDVDGGTTALSRAAIRGNLDMVKFLFEHGANVNAKTEGNYTPLYSAINGPVETRKEVAKFLVDHGADVDERDEDGRTLLMDMVDFLDAVKLLVELGANVNAKDKKGKTVLTYAKEEGFPSAAVIDFLLKHGAKE